MPERDWSAVVLALMGTWPGRLDEMLCTAYVSELQARGATDPGAVLRALRAYSGEHPPSASVLAPLVLREGQGDAPSFEEVVAFVARTISSRTKAGDDALSSYVAFVADELHEAPARWIADLGMPALREMPDPRYGLETGQRIRLRDHAHGYAEHVEAWRARPMRGLALIQAGSRDVAAGREIPEALRRVRAAPEIGPGA